MKIIQLSLLAAAAIFLSVSAVAQTKCAADDYDCQIAVYTKQITANSKNIEACYDRGLAFMNSGNFDRAIEDFSQYLALNPSNKKYTADGHNNRGISYKKKNLIDQAIADYNQAIILNPANPLFYLNLGNAYSTKKLFDDAIINFNKAISLKSDYAAAYVGRGHALMNKKDYLGALTDFDKAVKLNPNEAEAYYNRAVIESAGKAYSNAIADYDKYISINNENPVYLADGYFNRGLAYFDTGNADQALKDITLAINLIPENPSFYKARATVYRKQGKTALAESDERQAASLTK